MFSHAVTVRFGLTVPFELTPAWYAAYLRSNDPLSEYGIPVISLEPEKGKQAITNPQVVATLTRAFQRFAARFTRPPSSCATLTRPSPPPPPLPPPRLPAAIACRQPGVILLIDRWNWSDYTQRKQQRRGECEDGISWLSSSSTRPSVIALPNGQKLVTEYARGGGTYFRHLPAKSDCGASPHLPPARRYLYRRGGSSSVQGDISLGLQKHEIWLLDSDYSLVSTGAPGSRAGQRRPETPMPTRCLVHYIDKKYAVHAMKPPRVATVVQPSWSYKTSNELLIVQEALVPLVGGLECRFIRPVARDFGRSLAPFQVLLSPIPKPPASGMLTPPLVSLGEPLVAVCKRGRESPVVRRKARSARVPSPPTIGTWQTAVQTDMPGLDEMMVTYNQMKASDFYPSAVQMRNLGPPPIDCEADILGALFSFEMSTGTGGQH
ncbi:hypothetical protein T492DRAFT_1123221 [Pavlovales sp. CCMP2436]|nr:hypothetical protein T492DRAFT_1123221 [Pavlovales sp. CCMP2436]